MLSEGRAGIDNVYSLKEGRHLEFLVSEQLIQIVIGILTLRLDKESYERAGIVGKPEGVKGKRGTKPRWSKLTKTEENIRVINSSIVVELNLRLPAMLHGKKGFDRIVYAFKHVLTTPVTWLFHDLGKDGTMIRSHSSLYSESL